MSADRELLKLAAKAMGEEVVGVASAGFGEDVAVIGLLLSGQEMSWNPLTDDGDALRLLVALNLSLKVDAEAFTTYVTKDGAQLWRAVWTSEDGRRAAAREAITCAAAELGRRMP